ncbi:hypothetical protein NE634_11070 [Lacrimispora saccharolytica]|nr:hypothetical protein [Lacrimispora saccharolytica]
MDIERGNIKIIFQKIPYTYVVRNKDTFHECCTCNAIDEKIYMTYAFQVFPYASGDECRNSYRYMCRQMKDEKGENASVFRLIFRMADEMLCLDGDEIKCKFDQLLRWREISLCVGQDFFTCAYLAKKDMETGYQTKKFAWQPIIRSDNVRLHNILEKGVAENHFHLNGSTKVFELNWLCLMNHITGRTKEFKKFKKTMQNQQSDQFDKSGIKENFYTECQRAALYRVYLFLILKKNENLMKKAESLIEKLPKGAKTKYLAEMELSMIVPEIQNLIVRAGSIYSVDLDGAILDYVFEKDMIQNNNNVCRLLAGERRFLYQCYCSVLADGFNQKQKDIFYAYLLIKTDFRGEFIQTNNKSGFANFSDYQDRKEYFIEGHKAYENELVRLALNETLVKKNIVSLEARICPKKTSDQLYGCLRNYENLIKQEKTKDIYEKLIYVLHFPKLKDEPFIDGVARNNNVRRIAKKQARSTVAMLNKKREINCHIKGIDACSSEIACRPEVFGQVFRYLADVRINYENCLKRDKGLTGTTQNLYRTYHVGEDFFDIVDGLRAVDETILFCNLKRGDRLGHALALGIEPEKYYNTKEYRVIIGKQILLDDIVWMYCRASELGCHIEEKLKAELIEIYCHLYKEIFENNIEQQICPSIHEYFQSWKLRGDNPEVYKLEWEKFQNILIEKNLIYFDRYCLNPLVSNELRKNKRYRNLYYLYHYSKTVRNKGDEITEFKINKSYISLVRQIQDKMIQELIYKGIGIETNPSSNYLIGTITQYEEHPIIRFNSRKLKVTEKGNNLSVSINTDDQGVFDTLLENEYGLMALALKKATDENMDALYDIEDIYEWIDYVRRMGLDQVFS